MVEQQHSETMDSGDLGFTRLAGLSDGLFAIVLTLLVLELKLPEMSSAVTDAGLMRAMIDIYPKMFSYVLTFMVAGFVWASHHWDLELIVGQSRKLLWINLMLLFSVGLLPFTTNLIGTHLSPLSWSIYALNVIFMSFGLTALWSYAAAAGMIVPGTPRQVITYIAWRHRLAPILFLISIGIAQVNAGLASWSPALLPLAHIVLARIHPGKRLLPRTPPCRLANLWKFAAFAPLIGLIAWTVWAASH
jgi:uncharacterized membrane protein